MKNINNYMKIHFKNRYFPCELKMSLFVCDKKCGRAFLDTADFNHVCDRCNNYMKQMYSLNYTLDRKSIFKVFNYQPKEEVNLADLDFIDDITYEDLIADNVDCIGDISDNWIAVAVCSKECGYIGLLASGNSQICPKCGKDLFRLKEKKYLIEK